MDKRLEKYDNEYIVYIIQELEKLPIIIQELEKLPSCNRYYGWDYDDLEEVIEDGIEIHIKLPSYKQFLRDKKLKILLNE